MKFRWINLIDRHSRVSLLYANTALNKNLYPIKIIIKPSKTTVLKDKN